MSRINITAASDIDAPPAEVYALLSDYNVGHPSILPKPQFKEVAVEKGGQGAGTVFRLTMLIMGREMQSHMTVTEPEPGRVLQETAHEGDFTTIFTCDSLNGGQQTHLTIASEFGPSKGFKGFMERLFNPMVLKPLYKKELQNIADHFKAQHSASNPASSTSR